MSKDEPPHSSAAPDVPDLAAPTSSGSPRAALAEAGSGRAMVALRALEEVACAPGQPSLLMEICVDRVQEMVAGTGSAVALLQEGELVYATTAGQLRGRLVGSQPVAHSFGGLAVTTGGTLHTADARTDPRVARDVVAALGVRSVIATPLMQNRRRIGVLWVTSAEPHAFDQTDVDLVARLGRVASARLDYALVGDERRGSEQALVDSQLQHAAVLASLDEGVLVLDEARRVLRANAAAERILGVPRERLLATDALGLPWQAITDDGVPLATDAGSATQTRRGDTVPCRTTVGVQRPDGARRWLSVSTVPVFDPSGDLLRGVVATFSDVTEKRERTGRERSERRLLDALENLTGSGVWHWRAESAGPHWSAGMYRLLGGGADRPPTLRAYLRQVHPDDRHAVCRALARASRAGGCHDLTHRLVRADGAQRTVRCSGEVRLGPDGRPAAAWGCCHDTTDSRVPATPA